MNNFLNELRQELMTGDGAIGTLLYHRGLPLGTCYDALNLSRPEVIQQVHADYLEAGARLIETNTFGASRLKLERHGLVNQVREINRRGAELAAELAHPRGAFVAGSAGPLSSHGTDNLSAADKDAWYREQFEGLLAGGVDALFLESFTKVSELEIALRVAKAIGAPALIVSLSFSDDGHTADGLRINEAFARLRAAGADVTGLNCHFGPTMAETLLKELDVNEGDLISVYPNAGRPQFHEGRYVYHPTPQYFADLCPRLVAEGARLIGGCCGTTPETIQALAATMAGKLPVTSKPGLKPRNVTLPPTAPPPPDAPSLLEIARQRTLIVTELDPPKSLSLDKMIEGSRALREAGTDFVTLADNSLAILRVSNMAAGQLIKAQTGLEPVIHLACRDRNLLGLQSELMGLHALGMHHVLVLTGDPAKVGDHPGASSVYDVNSIGLIKTIARLNEGFAANGRDLKDKTRFIIGCAFNPNSRNLDLQVRKLADKLEAGAHFVMTQPIFDPALARATFEKTRHFGVPILVGVMPLLNMRNTEFLHHEVPGITIPDVTRERMRGKEGPVGNAEGIAIARELCDAVLEHFNGIYLITPLMRYDLTVELSQHVRQQTAAQAAART
jgi:methionine synthase I (cobalamin-dependent)/5,10-methylenetetrahydrofolate reductase